MNPCYPWNMLHDGHKHNGVRKPCFWSVLILFWVYFDKLVRDFLISQWRKAEELTIEDFIDNIKFCNRPGFCEGKYRKASNRDAIQQYNKIMTFWFRVTFGESNPFVVRVISDRKDLSLMIKPDKTLKECLHSLVGYLEPIGFPKVHEYLAVNHFSSFYEDMILFGPMSYVEHNCSSVIWFTVPKPPGFGSTTVDFLEPPKFCYKHDDVVKLNVRMPDEIDCDEKEYERKKLLVKCTKEKLLEVKYTSGNLWFKCTCTQCSTTATTTTTKRKR
jgi:hypothetical protein